MYIKVFDGAAVIFCEEQDRPCSNPQGHDFNPDNGAMFGDNGNFCAHCGHFTGWIEYFSAANGAAEAQAYAQVMLGATGPVEVRGIKWKWGPGDVPKSPIMSAANARSTSLISAAPDLLAALERLTSTLDAISLSDEEAWTSDLIAARAAIAKAYEEVY